MQLDCPHPRPGPALLLLLSAAALAGLLLLPACKGSSQSAGTAKQLAATNFGLGISLGQTPQQVQAVLGAPSGSREVQAGLLTEEYWTVKDPAAKPEDVPPVPGPYDPQLTLSYVNGKLAQVYSAYKVDDPSAPLPPYTAEALPGIKLGAKRTDLLAALGKPKLEGNRKDSWHFEAGDGTAYGIDAIYVRVEEASAYLTTAIKVSFFANASNSRGEQFEKQQKANEALHGD